MTTATMTASLVRLGKESNLQLSDPAEDIRGRKVLDKAGTEIAQIEDLLLDEREKKVRFLMVGSGGHGVAKIGKKKSLIPVDAITAIDAKAVTVDQSGEQIIGAPEYDPEIIVVPEEYWDSVYGWYGYYPFWRPYYRYPGYPLIRRW